METAWASIFRGAFIEGEPRAAKAGTSYYVENPANGQPVAEVAECGVEDVNDAVVAATVAAGEWSQVPPARRKDVLVRFSRLIEEHLEELALLETLATGKPISDARTSDIPESAQCIRWHAEAADKLYGEVAPTGPDSLGMIVREPVGVVGAIIPWNYPAQMAAWKIGPALATGNTVIIKPAHMTPLSLLRMAELGSEAGLPPGALNVLPGRGEIVGTAIARHPGIDLVAFTGSTAVGRTLLAHAGETNLKRVLLELGGKSPQIVLEEPGDLDMVAARVAAAIFKNMGENCSAGSRLLVHQRHKSALVERVAALAETDWAAGDPLVATTRTGPLISGGHKERVLNYVRIGRQEGARLITGGTSVLEDTGGHFVAPTVFDTVTNNMRVAQEEIFGPVLAVIAFDNEREAVSLANDSPYGLAATLYTENVKSVLRIARALRVGTVSVNTPSTGDYTVPFGGYKLSGYGGHDKSAHAHDQYTELKTIWIDVG